MIKAVFKGWLAIHVLAFIAVLAMCPFWWTLVFVHYPTALFLDNGVSSAIPWLSMLLAAGLLTIGGYVAASNTSRGKLPAGFLVSAAMAAWVVLGAFLTEESGPEKLLDICTSLFCIVVFPPVGALIARKRRRRDAPARPLRRAHVLLAYAAIPLGVLLPLAAGLLRHCWMQGERVDDFPDAAADVLAPSMWLAGVGLVFLAYAITVFVKTRGWKKGVVLNWYSYVVAITACGFAFGFLERDRENRPGPNFLEWAYGHGSSDADSDFVFPDPDNPATLYIQASGLIPEYDSEEGDSDPRLFSAAEKTELIAFLADKADALAMAFRADDKAPIRFPSYGVKAADWTCTDLDRLCEVLAAKARLAAGQGDIPEALRCLGHIFRISQGLYDSSGDNMQLGCYFSSTAVHVLRDMLMRLDLSRQQLSLIAGELRLREAEVLPDRESWANALRSKPADTMEELFWLMRRKSPWTYLLSQFVSKDAILARRTEVFDTCLSKPSWRGMFETSRAEARAHHWYMFEPFFAPASGQASRKLEGLARADIHETEATVERFLAQLTRVRLLRVSAAALLYRKSNRKLPAAWNDLAPAHLSGPLSDPFSDKPLLLTSGQGGLCAYSVGPDGEDDGGTSFFSYTADERDSRQDDYQDSGPSSDIGVVVQASGQPTSAPHRRAATQNGD